MRQKNAPSPLDVPYCRSRTKKLHPPPTKRALFEGLNHGFEVFGKGMGGLGKGFGRAWRDWEVLGGLLEREGFWNGIAMILGGGGLGRFFGGFRQVQQAFSKGNRFRKSRFFVFCSGSNSAL